MRLMLKIFLLKINKIIIPVSYKKLVIYSARNYLALKRTSITSGACNFYYGNV